LTVEKQEIDALRQEVSKKNQKFMTGSAVSTKLS
jgi:hypothetical protein